MSDRIGIMNEGRILQLGTPDDIYELSLIHIWLVAF